MMVLPGSAMVTMNSTAMPGDITRKTTVKYAARCAKIRSSTS
jgi:hypothetical protein